MPRARLLPVLSIVFLAATAPAADLTIPQIQGSGLASPVDGEPVTTRGNTVTAVAADGFFIQGAGDGDPATSDGIFVFTRTAPAVSSGDVVDVTGTVDEYFGFTEITTPTVARTGSGAALPQPAPLVPTADPQAAGAAMERLEGMLVRIEGAQAVSGTDEFGDFYAVAGSARPFREAGIEFPGLAGLPVWDGNREIFEIDTDRLGSGAQVIAGAAVDRAAGPSAIPSATTRSGRPSFRLRTRRSRARSGSASPAR